MDRVADTEEDKEADKEADKEEAEGRGMEGAGREGMRHQEWYP